MRAYLGLTCHFICDEWKIISYFFGSHTEQKILSEFEEIIDEFKIRSTVYKAVTDNASNMKKAFADDLSLPGFINEADIDMEIERESDKKISDDEEAENNSEFDSILKTVPDRISCFAHTLQLCVKDGISASSRLTSTISKVRRIVNHVKKSTAATERLEELSGKSLVSKYETRWNSQLKMIQRVLEVEVNDVVEKRVLHLSAYDKNRLREFVEVFE